MLNLPALVSMDEQFATEPAIPECLGDRFLYRNNPLFRCVRDRYLALGYKYVCETDPKAQEAFAAPLLSLETMILGGWVPYHNNLAAVRGIIASHPSFQISAPSLIGFLAHNHVLHESAHLIADPMLKDFQKSADLPRESTVLRALVGEAFANTVECLTTSFSGRSHLHRFFLALNSYQHYSTPVELQRHERILSTLVSLFGFPQMFKIGMLSFLHSNIHDIPPSDEVVTVWVDQTIGSTLPTAEWRLLEMVLRSMFVLDPGFRRGTSEVYFNLVGLIDDYHSLQKNVFDRDAMTRFAVLEQLEILSGVVSGCHPGDVPVKSLAQSAADV